MKILYLASIRFPTEKAHGIQIMKTCEALSELDLSITLSVPKFIFGSKNEDPFEYYGVKKIFKINKILSLRLIYLGPIGFFLETLVFFIGLIFSSEFWQADYIFSRDEMLVSLSRFIGKKTVWETHTGSYNLFARYAIKKSRLIICISQGLKNFYLSKGVSPSKFIVCHDAVDLKDFQISISPSEARNKLGLSQNKKIVLYAGRLDGWKGVETLFEAAKIIGDEIMIVVIGGDKSQIDYFAERYKKIVFLGYKLYKDLPLYLKAADVLVVPNTAKNQISELFTSPLKVFSYMASGVPIVASDLPSIREVLNKNNSILVTPDDSQALLEGIHRALEVNKSEVLSKQALSDVQKYTWLERAKCIAKFL